MKTDKKSYAIRNRGYRPILKTFGCLFVCFVVFCLDVKAAPVSLYEKTFPLPIGELEMILAQVLSKNGFQYTEQTGDHNKKRIIAEKASKKIMILMAPRSPIASKCTLQVFSGEDTAILNPFVESLFHQLEGDHHKMEQKEQPIPVRVPTQILSHAEATVCISSEGAVNGLQLSGFFAGSSGIVVSTAHNLSENDKLSLAFFDGTTIRGVVKHINLDLDLSIIQAFEKPDAFIEITDGRERLEMGDRVYSIGCPNNLNGLVFQGTVNSPPRLVNNQLLWQVNMETHPGSSGSPVFDGNGKFFGVVKGRYRGTDTIGFLIPFKTVNRFLEEYH